MKIKKLTAHVTCIHLLILDSPEAEGWGIRGMKTLWFFDICVRLTHKVGCLKSAFTWP